jgi:hypothetical protein
MDLMTKISDKLKKHGIGNSGHLITKKKKKPVQSIAQTLMLRRKSPIESTEEIEIQEIKEQLRNRWRQKYRNI